MGVSVTDRDAAVEALLLPDDAGLAGGKFREYVEGKNAERDAATTTTMPVTFTSIGQVIGDYVNLLTGDAEDLAHKKAINPIVETDTQVA